MAMGPKCLVKISFKKLIKHTAICHSWSSLVSLTTLDPDNVSYGKRIHIGTGKNAGIGFKGLRLKVFSICTGIQIYAM